MRSIMRSKRLSFRSLGWTVNAGFRTPCGNNCYTLASDFYFTGWFFKVTEKVVKCWFLSPPVNATSLKVHWSRLMQSRSNCFIPILVVTHPQLGLESREQREKPKPRIILNSLFLWRSTVFKVLLNLLDNFNETSLLFEKRSWKNCGHCTY